MESLAGQGGEQGPNNIPKLCGMCPEPGRGVQRGNVGLALPLLGSASGTRACERCLSLSFLL